MFCEFRLREVPADLHPPLTHGVRDYPLLGGQYGRKTAVQSALRLPHHPHRQADSTSRLGAIDKFIKADSRLGAIDKLIQADSRLGAIDKLIQAESRLGAIDKLIQADSRLGAIDKL